MNILFLLSCLEPAGSETYCVSLAKAWGPRHKVFWISDTLHYGQEYLSLPISQKAIPGGVRNTLRVKRFIEEHKIDLVHSHSRRAHWVAAQAAALCKIPHVTTIHQPPPVHLFSKLFPCLGDQAIAIDEVVARHLETHFKFPKERIHLIRNGIDLPPATPASPGDVPKVLLLGRLTGGRWRAASFVFDVLKRCGKTLPRMQFLVAGRVPEEHRADLERELAVVSQAIAPSTIQAVGFIPNLASYVAGCDVVIAGGRSALESMAQEKPVIAMGEGGILGLVSPETLASCLETNFGDHLSGLRFVPAMLELSLRQALTDSARMKTLGPWGRQHVETYYNLTSVAQAVDQVYALLTHTHVSSRH